MGRFGAWISIPDKSTRHGVFLHSFFWGIHPLIGIIYILHIWRMQYDDPEKNKLKYKGALWGLLVLPALATIVGLVFLIKHVSKTYKELKKYGVEKDKLKKRLGLDDQQFEALHQALANQQQKEQCKE